MVEQPAKPGHLLDVLGQVGAERVQLDQDWDDHDRADGTWAHMIHGQLGAALAELDPVQRRARLVRLGALAVAWVQALDRRPATEVPAAVPALAAVGAVAGGA